MSFKNLIFITFLIFVSLVAFSQEANETSYTILENPTKQELTEKEGAVVTPRLEVYQYVGVNMRGLQARPSDIYWYEDPVFTRTHIKASLDIKKNNLTISPYVTERLESYTNFFTSSVDPTAQEIATRLRNRIYVGTTIAYDIPDIISLALMPDFRLQFNLIDGVQQAPDVQFRFAPIFSLSGSYDFGFKWSYLQETSFDFTNSSVKSGKGLTNMAYEAFLNLSYEFLQHLPNTEGKRAEVFFDYSFLIADTTGFSDNPVFSLDGGASLGLRYSQMGITPSLGLYMWNDHAGVVGQNMEHFVGCGIQAGVAYSIERFSFRFNYYGGQQVSGSTPIEDREWQSHFFTIIQYKI